MTILNVRLGPYPYHSQHSPLQHQQVPTHFEPGYRLGRASAPSLLSTVGGSGAQQDLSYSNQLILPAGTGPGLGLGGAALTNKRRSLADLLFVPIKSKEKRNSSSSSASSVDSYRHEEPGHEQPQLWNMQQQPKPVSKKSDSGHISPPPGRKLSKGGKALVGGGAGSSPKTFQCTGYPGCNMVFTRSEHLARHERKHTGEKPYRCIVANCPRVFSRYDNMIQHTQTHSDRSKRDPFVPGSSGPQSRSSSVQSTPVLPGPVRGGSSPVVFGQGHEDQRFSQHNSPVAGYGHSPAFVGHPGQPVPQSQTYTQAYQGQQHPIQWTLPSGAPANSPSLVASRGSISHLPSREGGVEVARQQLHSNHSNQPHMLGTPNTLPVRTLKANSRSLPHLQPRDSPGGNTGDSPSLALQHGMSGMEIEEIKRRKSEVLLPPSTLSGPRAPVNMHGNRAQGIGLGVSPFTPSTAHPGSLSQVEKLTQQEQARLNEHRRSAQAMLLKGNASTGSIDTRPPSQPEQPQTDYNMISGRSQGAANRSGSIAPPLSHVKHLSAREQNRLIEHRKSTPELMYDSNIRLAANDDIAIQPLVSRDDRSGMQWFSQVNTSSPSYETVEPPSAHQSSEELPAILPPLLGHNDLPNDKPRSRHQSSHVHPLSRHSSLSSPFDLKAPSRHRVLDTFLHPSKETLFQQQFAPIQKCQVVDAIERMDPNQFLDLTAKASITYANEQIRNPLFLGNIVAILSVVTHSQATGSLASMQRDSPEIKRRDSDIGVVPQRVQNAMDVDDDDLQKRDNMDVDRDFSDDVKAAIKHESKGARSKPDEHTAASTATTAVSPPLDHTTCRFALDIDQDAFRRDPGPVLRHLNELTISTRRPIVSFVSGLEPTIIGTEMEREPEGVHGEKENSPLPTLNKLPLKSKGYPSDHHVRLGRFYLPEYSYPVHGAIALVQSLGHEETWRTCEFREYPGVSIWVPERVLMRYRALATDPQNKMALTLVPRQEALEESDDPSIISAVKREHTDDSTVSNGGDRGVPLQTDSGVSRTSTSSTNSIQSKGSDRSDYTVMTTTLDLDVAEVSEHVLHREIIAQVWADMHREYTQHQHQVHMQLQQQQQHKHQDQQPQHHYFHPSPATQNRVATFEEHQRSLSLERQRQDHYRHHSYPAHPHPQRHHPYAPRGGSIDHQHEPSHYYSHQHGANYSQTKEQGYGQIQHNLGAQEGEQEISEELRHRVLDRHGVLEQEASSPRQLFYAHKSRQEVQNRDGQIRHQQEDDDEETEDGNEEEEDDHDDEERRDQITSSSSASGGIDGQRSSSATQQQQTQHQQPRDANMLRRISIAELCNPMKSLATERKQNYT
ncbi:hypothetical protein BG004_001587 [Podila humilis]|nr:hypothetical protein BG004_001587 [Podila humilis]